MLRDIQEILDALEALADNRIDTSDIPEQADCSKAARGLSCRPVKQQITLRLDADGLCCKIRLFGDVSV